MILISGDSWSCGEWAPDHPKVDKNAILHGGLAQYLKEQGYPVINLGRGGGCNLDSSTNLLNFLILNPDFRSQINSAVVFQTSWIRDVPRMASDELKEIFNSGYIEGRNRLISRFYYKLTDFSTEFNIPVHVIGGESDTIWLDRFLEEYPGVSIACQSMINLLLESNARISQPVYGLFHEETVFDTVTRLKSIIGLSEIELMFKDVELGHARQELLRENQQLFYPDGTHANRTGHLTLFNYLNNIGTIL